MNASKRLRGALLGALLLSNPGSAFAAMVIPPVTFDLDSVGSQSGNPNLVHSTLIDWTVASDPILDTIPAENVYQSTHDQTNLKVEFPTVTLAPGESLRVKVDYRYLAPPNDPGIQPYNFLRFGAYNTHGTATYTDDQGYLADVSYWESASTSGSSTKAGDYSIRREDNVWDDFDMGPLLDNDTSPVNWTPPPVPETGDIRTMQQPDGSMATFYKGADEGTVDHAAVICITNTGDAVEVCLFHGHPAMMVGRAVDLSGSPIVSFDTIYLESPSDNSGFNIDNIGIQHLPQGMGCCGDCFELEDLNLGDTYAVGDTFTVQDASGTVTLDVEAIPFVWSSGTVFTGGTARVENGGLAGHGGTELNVNNIGLRFSSASGPVPGVSMLFGEYGGNLNFSINGDFHNFDNFQDINGSVIGGALVVVIGGNGNDQGQLLAIGGISEFTVGGQELYIDHICPEMGDDDQPDDDQPDDDHPDDDPNDRWGKISGHKFKGGEEASNNLFGPFGLAFSDAGMLYVANEGRGGGGWHVSEVDTAGVVDTFALGFNGPSGVAYNSLGELHISDDTNRVFLVDPLGSVSTFIDTGAGLSNPNAIAFDSTDHLYVVSSGGFVYRFLPDGSFDKMLADGLSNPESVVVDETIGMLFVSDVDGKIWQMDMAPTDHNTTPGVLYADTGAFTEGGLSQDAAGNLYLSAYNEGSVYRVAPDGGITVIATGISQARGSTIGPDGKLYVTSYDMDEVHRIDLSTFAVEFYAPTAVAGVPSGPGGGGLPGWVIYLDQNRNGMLDAGETSTVTDASGYYEFNGLAPDIYYVAEEMQPGWVQVVPGAPDFDYTVLLGPGDHVTDVDFVNIPEEDEDCLAWYRANDPGAVMVSGTLSEIKAADFDAAVSLMAGEHGLIDFEGFTVGDFTTKVLDHNVTAALPNTGDAVTGNQPGIADSTTSSSGLGFNTTSGGDQHLQVLPLNNGPDGGVVLSFSRPAKALGFYLIGLEETKREVWAFIEFADGSNQAVLTDVGLNPGGGMQFFGFIAENCPVKQFSLIELYDGEPAGDRDIFGVDDIRYVVDDSAPAMETDLTTEDLEDKIAGHQDGENDSDGGANGNPGQPADDRREPGQPGEQGPNNGRPFDPNFEPGKPGEHGPNNGRPFDPNFEPGQPGEHGPNNGRPFDPDFEPGQPGEHGPNNGRPFDPNFEPGQPGEHGPNNGRPFDPNFEPGQPGEQGPNNGRPFDPNFEPGQPGEHGSNNGRPFDPNFEPGQSGEHGPNNGRPFDPNFEPGQPGEHGPNNGRPFDPNFEPGQPGEHGPDNGRPFDPNFEPGQPGEHGPNNGRPFDPDFEPGQPGEHGPNNGRPFDPNFEPGQPGEHGPNNGRPFDPDFEPGQPGEHGPNNGRPFDPNFEPGQPGEHGPNNGRPFDPNFEPGQPGEQGPNNGRPFDPDFEPGQPGEHGPNNGRPNDPGFEHAKPVERGLGNGRRPQPTFDPRNLLPINPGGQGVEEQDDAPRSVPNHGGFAPAPRFGGQPGSMSFGRGLFRGRR